MLMVAIIQWQGKGGYYWSSTADSNGQVLDLGYTTSTLRVNLPDDKHFGNAVRCIKN